MKQTFFDNACSGEPGADPRGVYRSGQAPQVFDSDRFLSIYGATGSGGGSRGGDRELLEGLSGALLAFQRDLEADGLDSQVLTMTFSEFGRRPGENESKGTDHGTAAPLFVMGGAIGTSLVGAAPSLEIPRNGDLSHETDFRSVYATILEKWLGCPSEPVLGKSFEILPILRSSDERSG